MILLIPILVSMMLFIRREYDDQERELARPRRPRPRGAAPRAAGRHPGQRHQSGRHPGGELRADDEPDVRAVFVTEDPEVGEAVRERWERQVPGVPLVIVESPYRAVISPVLAYLDVLDQAWPPDKEAPITIVVLPEYVARHWWERLLYNQTAKRLQGRDPGARAHRHRRRALPPRAPPRGDGRPGPHEPARWYRGRACRRSTTRRFHRAVVALNGGPSDARIVRLVVSLAPRPRLSSIAVHVVEIDWTLPLDADIAGRSEEVQRVLDFAEAHRRGLQAQDGARAAPGPRRRGCDRR